ncbi:MAG TPA: DUF4159 domain-containing protein [Tepidisphaeraceae bacterium]|jgi:hypothetical protein|nr:DUF4159 domain-containing protein [Tepidisphaeraceae bacterium]
MTRFSGGKRWRTVLRCAVASISLITITASVNADVSSKEVNAAVDKGVAHLLSLQKPDGSWETMAKPKGKAISGPSEDAKWGGETAICTYALLAAGQSVQTEPMKKAIKWLEEADLHGTYAVGLRSQVWHLIPELNRNKIVFAARDRDRDFVVFSRIQRGRNIGFYGYAYGPESEAPSLGGPRMIPMDPKGPKEDAWYDRSNSQYGVLGAWALEQAGAEIPTAYWMEEDAAWKKAQLGDGGWNYRSGGEGDQSAATYTMTAAGIATLFITQDYVMRINGHQFDSCRGGAANPNIEKGLAWMDKHISKVFGGGNQWHYYGLYGIERIGVASGRKYFDTVDWYKTGAENIVRGQHGDGSWGAPHDTCFAILFLVNGRAPVMMNKVIYQTASKKQIDPWNERPRDAANLAKWMGPVALDGTRLNWQVVNLKVPADELHDAPILYLAGSEELSLSNQDIDKLREFVEQGGMILGNADCGSRIFSSSFEKLGTKLFPKYEFRKLPANHPIYAGEMFSAKKWRQHPVVEGMSNGVRELMMLIPEADLSRAWQTDSTKTRSEAFQLAGNIFLYATGKENLFDKGDSYIVHAVGEGGKEIKVARLDVGDNPDPEPGAWRRLSAIMHNTRHVDVKTETVKLGSNMLAGYKIADLTGTTKLVLSAAQRAEIKDFVDKGGTLIVDAAGGSSEFATSAENELLQIFGTAAAKGLGTPLAPDNVIYTDPNGKIDKIAYRSFARTALTGSMHEPRIRGIEVNGRIGVFYSREDITEGLVGEQVDAVVGYAPNVAAPLMANMVMYAAKGAPPAGAPAAGAPAAAPRASAGGVATPAPAASAK